MHRGVSQMGRPLLDVSCAHIVAGLTQWKRKCIECSHLALQKSLFQTVFLRPTLRHGKHSNVQRPSRKSEHHFLRFCPKCAQRKEYFVLTIAETGCYVSNGHIEQPVKGQQDA